MALTDTFLKQVKHKGGAHGAKYSDGGGLYLLVNAAGKYWRMAYRFAGKQKTLALGVYPAVTLAKARQRREEAREVLADGRDPSEAKREGALARTAEAANTFKAIALEWHAMKARGGHTESTTTKRLAHLETHIFPEVGHRPIKAIKPSELLAMLRKVAAAGTAYTAIRLREICGQVFRFAIATDRADYNPAADLLGALETPPVKHRPALTTRREFGQFVRDLKAHDKCYPLTKQAARFAMLTWTRPKELRTARWEHFDIEAKEWRVPAINMKMGKHLQAHTVPLSVQALEVLEEIRELSGEVPVLFPGIHGADSIISENTINLLFKKMGYRDRQSHHGLRASARSLLSERGWTAAALEAQLDHAERNKVISAYARSEHLVERRKFMDDWGSLVAALEAGDNVIAIKTADRA
jgi:integrase